MRLKNLINYLLEETAKDGEYWYHTTSPENIEKIRKQGLKINPSGIGKSLASLDWMDSIYGMTPIFLSRELGEYRNGVVLKVNVEGLKLVADVPSLTDWGAQVTEDGDRLFFDEGDAPEELSEYLNESGEILYSDLTNPNYLGTKAAIDLTETAAVMEDIGPGRIEVTDMIVEIAAENNSGLKNNANKDI